jgi:hypothetical protein
VDSGIFAPGMTWLARLLLVLTCMAPVAFVEAAVAIDRSEYRLAIVLFATVIALVALCLGLLAGVRRFTPPVPKEVTDAEPKVSEPLAFLVSYALPMIASTTGQAHLLPLGAFALVMGIALWQLQVFHVNPLLAIFGYKFFGAKSGGIRVLVLTRREVLPNGNLSVFRMSDFFWLHGAAVAGGDDESSPRDSARAAREGSAS